MTCAEEKEKTSEDGYIKANQQRNVEEEHVPAPPPSAEDINTDKDSTEIEEEEEEERG